MTGLAIPLPCLSRRLAMPRPLGSGRTVSGTGVSRDADRD